MIANVPVRMKMMMTVVAAVPATTVAAVPATTVAAVHSAAAMHSAAAVTATVAAHGAGRRRSKHGKAERSARGDGQKGRFANHDTLL
jgi:hypothetical protein